MEEYVIKNQKKLRLGITTGTCSAVAAQAAAMKLLLDVESHTVTLRTPKGMTVSVPVYLLEADSKKASYKVIKDSGDDPDVTNGTDVCVTVEFVKQRACEQKDGSQDRSCAFTSESFPYLTLDGGPGIGRVTKEGLEQAVGQAAINRVPRQMIFAAAAETLITVFSGITTVAIWSQGSFVNFKDCSGFSGSSGKNIIIYRIMGVVAVTEDFDTGILHDIDKSFCVLVSGTGTVVPGMHACDGIIKFT